MADSPANGLGETPTKKDATNAKYEILLLALRSSVPGPALDPQPASPRCPWRVDIKTSTIYAL
jgi:hypothetical protein